MVEGAGNMLVSRSSRRSTKYGPPKANMNSDSECPMGWINEAPSTKNQSYRKLLHALQLLLGTFSEDENLQIAYQFSLLYRNFACGNHYADQELQPRENKYLAAYNYIQSPIPILETPPIYSYLALDTASLAWSSVRRSLTSKVSRLELIIKVQS